MVGPYGVQAVPSTTQTVVYRSSLAEVTSPSDFARLTKSESVSSAISLAGLEINGDGITISGSGSLTISSSGSTALTMTGANPASATISVPVTLGLFQAFSDNYVQVDAGDTLTLSGALTVPAGTILHKRGLGTLVLSGPNAASLAASISVEEGTLRIMGANNSLGTAAVTVASGAALELSAATVGNNTLNLTGTGINGAGVLRSVGTGTSTWGSGATAINFNTTTVYTAPGTTLLLNGTLVGLPAGNYTMTKNGTGIMQLGGSAANSNLTVQVNEGELDLAKTAAVQVANQINIGDNVGNTWNALAKVTTTNGQSLYWGILIDSTGKFDLNGFNLTISGNSGGPTGIYNLQLNVGSVVSGWMTNSAYPTAATLTLNGAVASGGNIAQGISAVTSANAATQAPAALIDKTVTLSLGNLAARVINTTDRACSTTLSAANPNATGLFGKVDLEIDATVNGGGTTSTVTTAGSGRLVLTGPWTDSATTGIPLTVASGTIVNVRSAASLGNITGVTAPAVTVASGGTLELDGTPISTIAEASGTTATVVTSSANGLAVGQAITITGSSVAGFNGAWTVLAVNSPTQFTFTTTGSALGSATGGTVAASMTLANAMTINGGGATELFAGGVTAPATYGALRVLNGTQTWSGTVTLGAAATIRPALGASINFSNATASIATVTFGLNISGQGTAIFSGPTTTTGTAATTIDGATVILNGANGAFAAANPVTVDYGATLELDNSGTVKTNRLGGTMVLTLNTGRLWLKGNATTAVTETIATVTLTAGTTNTIQSDTLGSTNTLTVTNAIAALATATGGQVLRFVASSSSLIAIGATGNTIALTASPTLVNGIIPRGVVISPTGQADLATYSGGTVLAYSSYVPPSPRPSPATPRNANLLLDGSGALPVGLLTANPRSTPW